MAEGERFEFNIRLAGRLIHISSIHEEVRLLCKDYIEEDLAECDKPDASGGASLCPSVDFSVEIQQKDIDFEREKSAREDELEGREAREFGASYLETLAVYRQIAEKMPDYDTFLFHGSAIKLEAEGAGNNGASADNKGEAVIFTGLSGAGKSTHAMLWSNNIDGVSYINDDKPLISLKTVAKTGSDSSARAGDDASDNSEGADNETATETIALVHGTAWDGKHSRSNNTSVPIKAICMIVQDNINSVQVLGWDEIFPILLQQSYRPAKDEQFIKTLLLIDRLRHSGISFYRINCNKESDAAIIAHNAIFG